MWCDVVFGGFIMIRTSCVSVYEMQGWAALVAAAEAGHRCCGEGVHVFASLCIHANLPWIRLQSARVDCVCSRGEGVQ